MNEHSNPKHGKAKVFIGVMLAIAACIWGLIAMTPKGFDMSLEQIGTGKPTLVFVFDPHITVSLEQTDELSKAREYFKGEVLFLVAKIGTQSGDQLIADQSAQSAELLLFDGAGSNVARAFALKSSRDLVSWITANAL